jgi:serine/threonine protein kinase
MLKHKQIAHFVEHFEDSENLYIIMEYYEVGTLHDYIFKKYKVPFTLDEIKDFAR